MVERNQSAGTDQRGGQTLSHPSHSFLMRMAMDWVFGNLAAGTEDSLATDIRNINNELDNYTSAALANREVVQSHEMPEVSSSNSRPPEATSNYTTALPPRDVVQLRIPDTSSSANAAAMARDVQQQQQQQHRLSEQPNTNSPMGNRDVQQAPHRIPEIPVTNTRTVLNSREVVQTHRLSDVSSSNSRNPMDGRDVQHRMPDVPPQTARIVARDVHEMPEVSNSNSRPTSTLRVTKQEQISPPLHYQEQSILYSRVAGGGQRKVDEKKDAEKDHRNFGMNDNLVPTINARHNSFGKQVHLNHPVVAQNNIHPGLPNPATYGSWLDLSLPPPPPPNRNNLPLPPPPPPQAPQSRNNFPPSRPYWPVAWGCWWDAAAPAKLRKPSDIEEDSEKDIHVSRSPETSNMKDASTITSPGDVPQHVLSSLTAISPDRSYAALLQNGVNIDKFCNFNVSYNKDHHCRKLYFATDHFVRNLNNQNSSPSSSSSSSTSDMTNLKELVCTICSRQFQTREAYVHHEKTHMRIKEFDCHICSKSFTQKSSLSTHLKIHTGERDYVCNICNKTFSQKGSLLTHLKIHSGHKDFLCILCNKAFSQKSTLLIHMKIHSGTKDFICNICKKTFTQKGSLSIHLKTHSGIKEFVCNICKKAFTQKGSLQIHSKIHRGEKDYICPICNKAFTQKGSLLTHEKIHRGIKDFICSVCNKAFTQKVSLLTHAKTHLCHDDFASASKEYAESPKEFNSSPKDYITSKEFTPTNMPKEFNTSTKDYITSKEFTPTSMCNSNNKPFIPECQLINQSKARIGE